MAQFYFLDMFACRICPFPDSGSFLGRPRLLRCEVNFQSIGPASVGIELVGRLIQLDSGGFLLCLRGVCLAVYWRDLVPVFVQYVWRCSGVDVVVVCAVGFGWRLVCMYARE